MATTTTSIDPQIRDAYLNNLNTSQTVANNLGARQFAGYDPFAVTGSEMMSAAALGGQGMQNVNSAADLTAALGAYSPMAVSSAQIGPVDLAKAQSYTASQFGGAQAGPAALAQYQGYNPFSAQAAQMDMSQIGQYMNPFQQNVVDATSQQAEAARMQAIGQMGQQATAAKAFGGSRHGVAEGTTNAAYLNNLNNTLANLNMQGYTNAQQIMGQNVGYQQQANLANQNAFNQAGQFNAGAYNQAGLANQNAQNQLSQFNAGNLQQAGIFNAGAVNQAGQFGAGAANTASLQNSQMTNAQRQAQAQLQQQAALANQAAEQQAAQFRLAAANQLGNLGSSQQNMQYDAADKLIGMGLAKQEFAQKQLDATRNLGIEQLGITNSALGLQPGNVGSTTTAPTYTNTGANVLGGAVAGASLYKSGLFDWL